MTDPIEHKFLPGSQLQMTLLGTLASPNQAIIVSVYELNEVGPSRYSVRARANTGWSAPNGVPLVMQTPDVLASEIGEAWGKARDLYGLLEQAMQLASPNSPLMQARPRPAVDPKKQS